MGEVGLAATCARSHTSTLPSKWGATTHGPPANGAGDTHEPYSALEEGGHNAHRRGKGMLKGGGGGGAWVASHKGKRHLPSWCSPCVHGHTHIHNANRGLHLTHKDHKDHSAHTYTHRHRHRHTGRHYTVPLHGASARCLCASLEPRRHAGRGPKGQLPDG